MHFERASGLLMHPTSLPGPYGIGEIGPEAYAFIDRLAAMGQHLWQVLPLGPTSYGDSPYQSPSTFAGNHLLISFDQLVADGLLSGSRLKTFPALPADRVDFGPAIIARMEVLASVCRGFARRASDKMKAAFDRFCRREAFWLDEYALFMAIKEAHGGGPWMDWPKALALREPKALALARKRLATPIRNHKILQFLFHDQWHRLRAHAHRKRIKIIGDIPIFVAHDSSDVWAQPELFHLDGQGHPTVVAGVPPDYFSATGQLWGNPLYRWEVHEHHGYAWWIARLRKVFDMVDIVRIDHFRGFEAYWEIPGGEPTAIHGRWVEGPGYRLFAALRDALGELPIIAEDLGVITPPVEELRDRCGFPGMRVLQFAFGGDAKAEDYKPRSYPAHCVVYTGTHDNDTTVGWFWSQAGEGSTRTQEEIEAERKGILDYLGTDGRQIHWDLIGLAWRSKANTAVAPLQDLFGLGSEARMNVPGRPGGNWSWRFHWDQFTAHAVESLAALTRETGR